MLKQSLLSLAELLKTISKTSRHYFSFFNEVAHLLLKATARIRVDFLIGCDWQIRGSGRASRLLKWHQFLSESHH